ncbi:tyrosine-type recombinase/integrase [Micrococcaceae bacterium Sec5.7]
MDVIGSIPVGPTKETPQLLAIQAGNGGVFSVASHSEAVSYHTLPAGERAVRMVLDHLREYDSVYAAFSAIGPKLNIGRESLRRWVLQAVDSSSPRRLRDRAIILCVARLGLRAGEVVQLQLEDLNWSNATLRIRARKTGHGALLPLTNEVGTALAGYLQHGRPETGGREVVMAV